ncbi:MAG: endopeptidase La [Planctomycetota bacterium]|nr:endopeptidase La [Planctomycetota bacterium]
MNRPIFLSSLIVDVLPFWSAWPVEAMMEDKKNVPDDEVDDLVGSEPSPEELSEMLAEVLEDGAGQLVRLEETTPKNLFVLPLQRAVPFPGIMMPVQLGSSRARTVAQKAEDSGGFVLLLSRLFDGESAVETAIDQPQNMFASPDEDEDTEALDPATLYQVGTVARVLRLLNLPDGAQAAMLQGIKRVRVERTVRRKPFLIVRVTDLVDIPSAGDRSEAQVRNLQSLIKSVVDNSPHLGEEFLAAALNISMQGHLADFCAAYLVRDLEQRQRVLEELDIGKRLDLVVESLTKEVTILELGARIQDEIRQKIEKAQKEFFLREQIKIIRRELGEEVDARQAEIDRLARQIGEAGLPEAVDAKAREELERLKVTPVESPEHTVVRNHLDWIVSLPWQKSSGDRKDVRLASKILEEDHYGLAEVKERILEFLAVRKLKDAHGGPILCLSGPPGVGKTSLGRSIARAMGRRFWRFSLGGMRDEAEIKGHRRTYVGAMPGRILQGVKQCETNNPVIMLDEVDKLGSDFRGDPSSALLEVLDPEQNHAFLDHYLDVPFDLSRVFFVATANVLTSIPPALCDRMEVIEIAGYLTAEKVEIASRHLLPKQLAAHGLARSQLSLSKTVLTAIIERYTREAGVRGLEKCLSRICRKVALRVARGRKRKSPAVTVKELPKLLGPERFGRGGPRSLRVAGVCQGLAWTPTGGEVLHIEAVAWPGKGLVNVTGQLGEVMKESVRIAHAYLRAHAEHFGLDLGKIAASDLHVHFPAGAIPKDGPSAGITVAAALLSLWTGKRCPRDLAMTGELTAVGEVLPVGGVREKVLAARRMKVRRVVLPADNEADVREVDSDLIAGMEFTYVRTFAEVSEALGI